MAAVTVPASDVVRYGVFALLASVVLVVLYGSRPYDRWRLRHIPGPRPRWTVGHLLEIVNSSNFACYIKWGRKYGKIFKVFYGAQPVVVVTDPDLGRALGLKSFERPTFETLDELLPPADQLQVDTLVFNTRRRDIHRSLRAAWQPAFVRESLEGFEPLMRAAAGKLEAKLAAAANAGSEVEIWRMFGQMTMDVVGTAAFGVDFHTQDPSAKLCPEAAALMDAVATIFATSGPAGGGYKLLLMLAPVLQPLLTPIARLFPDADMRAIGRARRLLRESVRTLMAEASQPLDPIENGHNVLQKGQATQLENGHVSGPTARPTLFSDVPTAAQGATGVSGRGAEKRGKENAGNAKDKENMDIKDTAMLPMQGKEAKEGKIREPLKEAPDPQPRAPGPKAKRQSVAPGSFLHHLMGSRHQPAVHGGAPFTIEEITSQATTFILGGYETTANHLAFTTYLLAANPDKAAKLRQELDAAGRGRELAMADLCALPYLDAVFKESLRLLPPGHITAREAAEDLDVGGMYLPKGTWIHIALCAFQRDPAIWREPDAFVPERWLEGMTEAEGRPDAAWLPFGNGVRNCVGMRLAVAEAKLTLARLGQRFTFKLSPGQVPLKLRAPFTLKPEQGIFVTPVLRA